MFNGQPKQENAAVLVDMLQHTFKSLCSICEELRKTADVLRLPSLRRFPYCTHIDHWSFNYCTISVNYFAQSFKPNLPPEVIVEFSISRGELLVEAFYLLASQKKTTNINEGYHPSRKNFIGCIW
ncbi:hypothetical protein CCR75_009518 [Bremia lactucae]|uniref:Uncharacterized protein n=1 Tax=Bremia lactucae TaxID=4779 RepID=A0A976FKM8_BRELC|nr:hypothetical protein CCR75_009518 [Bremia lactucae]